MPKSKTSLTSDTYPAVGPTIGRGATAKPKPKPLKARASLKALQAPPSPSLDYQSSSSSTAGGWSSPIRWCSPSPPPVVRLSPCKSSAALRLMAGQSRSSSSEVPVLSPITNTSQPPCTHCKKPNDTPWYKQCSECREKRRKYYEITQMKKKLEDAEMNLEENAGATTKKRKSDQHSWLLGSASEDDGNHLSAKKKQKLDSNRESEIAKMMKRLKVKENIRLRAAVRNGRKDESLEEITAEKYPELNTYTDEYGHVWKEFQNSQEMYDFLQQRSSQGSAQTSKAQKKELVNFRGCYSIITSSSMNEKQRANSVVDELQTFGKVPFYHEIPTRNSGSKITFRCTCRASTSDSSLDRTLIPRTETVLVVEDPLHPGCSKMTKPKLKWRNTASGKRSNGYHIPRNGRLIEIPIEDSSPLRGRAKNEICGGRVVVSVEEDTSHPIFPGQRISVEVWHD